MPSATPGYAPDLEKYLKSLKGLPLEASVEKLISLLKRRQIRGSEPCAVATAHILLQVVARSKWHDVDTLLDNVGNIGSRLADAQPRELVVANIVRRVLSLIRDEAAEDRNEPSSETQSEAPMSPSPGDPHYTANPPMSLTKQDASGDHISSNASPQPPSRPGPVPSYSSVSVPKSLFHLLSASPPSDSAMMGSSSPFRNSGTSTPTNRGGATPYSQVHSLRSEVIDGIEEIMDEIGQVDDQIAASAEVQIHPRDHILVHQPSPTVERFVLRAAARRKFTVLIATETPRRQTGEAPQNAVFRKKLASAGITVITVTSSTLKTYMPHVDKVIIGARAVVANGGVVTDAGAAAIARAAREKGTPVFVLSGVYKLSPENPFHEGSVIEWGDPSTYVSYEDGVMVNSAEIRTPVMELVSPDFIDTYITNLNIANDSNLHVHVEEAPPPPYSETDIYSHSAGPRTPTVANTAASPRTDDGASRISSSASTGGEPVLTPPDTPRTASNPQELLHDQHAQPGAAALYFESRPPPPPSSSSPSVARGPAGVVVHAVNVDAASTPDTLPYQAEWASRGVTAQDWATFVNFLLPDHTTRGNDAVIDRKLRAEGGGDATSRAAGAQLEHVRESGPEAVRRREDAEATVRQWNDGFFGPRGISIRLDDDPAAERMPGSWDAAFDNLGTPEEQRARAQQMRDRAQQEREHHRERAQQHREQGRQQREQARQQQEQARQQQEQQRQQQCGRGRTWGGFNIDGDRVSYGDKFVADSNGLRIGSLIMDSSGIRMGAGGEQPQSATRDAGQQQPPQPPQPPPGPFTGPGRHGFGNHHHGRHDYHSWGDRHRRDAGWGWGGPGFHGGPPGHELHDGGRGRGRDRKGRQHRSDSVGSTSSSSSSSSSSSESSIGSLPDYDDVKEQQMPLYLARLQDWTTHPDQMRSKGDVKQLKAELKEAKATPVDPNMDKKALRAQIKGLTQAWKQLKKHQRAVRKATRRERHQRRRAEKRERKQHRRDMRRSRRDGIFGPGGLFGGRGSHCGWGGRGGGPAGAHAGRGGWPGTGGPWGADHTRSAPGAWPDEKQAGFGPGSGSGAGAGVEGQETGVATPPPGVVAAAKYRTADELESEMQRKTSEAIDLADGAERRAMEKELEALAEKLEQVRMEADEAYAKELAAQFGQ
ncbi:RING finger domain-containing protein [Purpureocillium lavendulum]|uniref:Translation initiation factor eIF2B subunit beta n=1 Tax=Purpureocillium lavendulum TaxID=1247861 RepID=A0AB34FDP1_9HYPO|nr:RING finger domain-containing protein [Purpureocillium lavendulum]